VYTDLGMIDEANPYMASALPLAAGDVNRYLFRVPNFATSDIIVTGDAMTDMAIDIYDRFENRDTYDSSGSGGAEVANEFRHVQPTWVAFAAREWQNGVGIYDLAINVREPPVTITEANIPYQSVCPFDGGEGVEVVWDGAPDDASSLDPVALQFPFDLAGEAVTDAWMGTNGYVTFAAPLDNPYINPRIPAAAEPNFLIAPMWDDLWEVTGCVYSAPDHIVFQWQGETWGGGPAARMQLILHADNSFDLVYGEDHEMRSDSATIGYENSVGDDGFEMIYNTDTPIIAPGKSWTITQP
jgi:hypothetical protein